MGNSTSRAAAPATAATPPPPVPAAPAVQAAPAPAAGPGPLLHYVPVLDEQGNVKRLGQGAYGSVYQYQNSQTGAVVALKRVQLTNLPPYKRDILVKHMPSELKNHYKLNHPHIAKMLDVFVTPNHLNIVLQFADGGTLFDCVNRAGEGLDEHMARWFFQQLVLTMDYFHRRGVSHRDIKLDNTLLVKAQPGRLPQVKVADFGLSKHDATLTYTMVGTEVYMSPEVFTATRPDGTGVGLGYNGEKADIWSAGVMLYTMLTRRYPFDDRLPSHQRLQVMTQRPLRGLPTHLSDECRELLEAMLHPNPDERMNIEGIKAHPWFLKGLPTGALKLTESYINAPPPCARTPEQIDAVIAEALQLLEAPAPAGAAAQAVQ